MNEHPDKLLTGIQALQQSDEIPDRISRHAAALVLAAMQARIHTRGQAADGSDIGSYSTKPIYVNPAKTPTPATFVPLGKWGKGAFRTTGQPHRTQYFDGGYQDFRQTAGLPADRVNLVLTGALRDSLILVKTGKEYLPGWDTAGHALQARAIEKKYGKPIWSWSEQERELMERTSRDLLTAYLDTGTLPDTMDADTGIGHLHTSYGDTAQTGNNMPAMQVFQKDKTSAQKKTSPSPTFYKLPTKPTILDQSGKPKSTPKAYYTLPTKPTMMKASVIMPKTAVQRPAEDIYARVDRTRVVRPVEPVNVLPTASWGNWLQPVGYHITTKEGGQEPPKPQETAAHVEVMDSAENLINVSGGGVNEKGPKVEGLVGGFKELFENFKTGNEGAERILKFAQALGISEEKIREKMKDLTQRISYNTSNNLKDTGSVNYEWIDKDGNVKITDSVTSYHK